MTSGSIKVQCVGCKSKRDLTLAEAAALTDVPFCPKCGMVEVAISATVRNPSPKHKDRRS